MVSKQKPPVPGNEKRAASPKKLSNSSFETHKRQLGHMMQKVERRSGRGR